MKRIFVDTNHFIALLYSRDQWHEKAVEVETANADCPLVTTAEVLIELLNFFCEHGRFARIKVTAFVHAVLVDVRTEVIFRSETNFLEALDLNASRPDKGYSLTDCISMNVCKSLGVDEVHKRRSFSAGRIYSSSTGFAYLKYSFRNTKKRLPQGTVIVEIDEIGTPSLILDIARVYCNAKRMLSRASERGVRLRPHIKTHKCVEVARIQTAGHDGAITVSTLAEARAFAKHGFSDITYAVPIERGKFADAIDILKVGVKLNLLTDDAGTVRSLDEVAGKDGVNFDIFVKIDCGTHRVGVEPHTAEAIEIPRLISDAKNLTFAGILTHAGHSYNAHTEDEILAVARHERDSMVELAERLRGQSIEVPTVSIGSTPTMSTIDHLDGIDEIRPGNYIFYDAFQATLGSCDIEDTALTVLTAVIHKDMTRKRIVVDAGAIALSKDRGPVELDPGCGYGHVLDIEGRETGMRVTGLSQEHGEVDAGESGLFDRIKVGDRFRILANHSCLTAAQHSHYNVVEDGQIVDRWEIHRGW